MQYPLQEQTKSIGRAFNNRFDMRDFLEPRRMTMLMWDFAFLTRHMPGDSFADYDKVLDEAVERGYNTIRIDPMPHVIDLENPEKIISRGPLNQPFNPWDRPEAFSGPLGAWLIEFMEKLQSRGLYYCLSLWSAPTDQSENPMNLYEATENLAKMLQYWKERFGFDRLIYVDLSNEYPYFLNGHLDRILERCGGRGNAAWFDCVQREVNENLRIMRNLFPELRFMVSLHGDTEWIDAGLELDAMDIHFYATSDPRYLERTKFGEIYNRVFTDDSVYRDFSERCMRSHKAMVPMYRCKQRSLLADFSTWSQRSGIPLLTTESWANWFYIDHPDMDWRWLLEWAEWSVEDAIDFNMWGWTPHNYCQPQFENWKDVNWHRRLTEKFLRS